MGSDSSAVMILANKDFRDEEYLETFEPLQAAGVNVKIASSSNEDCTGIGGTIVSTNFTFDEVDATQYDALILIGGVGIEGYLQDESVHKIIKSFVLLNKLVGAICWAPAILANAGVLAGKQATSWSGARKDLEEHGATYTGAPLSVDGNIITAIGPDAATQFGTLIAKTLTE